MGSGRILACAVLLAAACAIDITDAVTLNQSRYDIPIVNYIAKVGDPLANIVVQYNDSNVSSIMHISYSVYGSARIYVNIDSTGAVTLKQIPRLDSTNWITFSVFVTVIPVSGNGTVPVYLSGLLVLRSVGLVRFNSTYITGVMNAFIPINSVVYDLTDNIVVETDYISSYTLAFSGSSSQYSVAYNGIVRTRRSLPPGRYSVRVRVEYTITSKNGTFLIRSTFVSFTGTARGCSSREEATLEWPTMGTCQVAQHTCSKFHPFLQGGFIGSYCTTEGEPSVPDYSRCCVTSNRTNPFAVVWLAYRSTVVIDYIRHASDIGNAVKSLFPRGIATSAIVYSIHLSNKYRSVSMSYNVQLSANVTLTQIQSAERYFKAVSPYRWYSLYPSYHGYNKLLYQSASRGIKAFMPSSCCAPYTFDTDDGNLSFISVPYCCGSGTNYGPCDCSSSRSCSPSSYAAGSCSQCNTSDIMHPELLSCANTSQATPTPSPPANETCVRFSDNSYTGSVYLGNVKRGVKILTVGMEACSDKHIKQYTVSYALNGYQADYFDIGKPTGEITLSGVPVSVRVYSFAVSAFVDITYKSGEKVQNFMKTSVRIRVHGGVTLNQTHYTFEVQADISSNQSIINFANEIVVDRDVVLNLLSVTFTRVSNTRFGVTSDGNLYLKTNLTINEYNQVTAYYTYVIVDVNQEQKTFSGTVSIQIVAKGCRQEEGGSYVWPVTHQCGAIKVPCHHFDSSFEVYGSVRRQCTKDGKWLQPDFSQCRLKYGSKPFLLVWFTFGSLYPKHWTDEYTTTTIGELYRYLTAFPVTMVTVHHNKESKVIYGFVQSFKIDLRSGTNLNGTHLLLLQDRIFTATRIGGRGKSRLHNTAGVLGFSTSDRCMRFDRESTVANFVPVCVMKDLANNSCQCEKEVMLSLPPCCTASGMFDRTQDWCSTTTPVEPIVSTATISVGLKLAGKGVQVSWFRSGGDAPSYYEIVYASTEIINYVKVPGTNSIYTIPRLLPGMIYTISVRGYYSNSDADSFSDSDNIWVPDMPVFKFQILFNGVISCTDLRSNLENIRTQLANALNSSCHCLSDADRLALIVHQCPYGKADNQVALVYGWIYDTSDQPGEKYFPIMQKMVGKATFSASSQKLVVTQTCDMNKYGSQCPPLPVAANIGAPSNGDVGPSTAAIIVLIIVAIVACILLAVILVILILKYKAKKQALKSDVALSSAAIAYSETTKKVEGNEEDHNELQKDF